MKTCVKTALPLSLLLFACSKEQTATNVVNVVLAEARFQRDLAEVKPQLPSALKSALLVVRAEVLKSDVSVQASPKQQEVSTGQGWSAALVQTTCVLKGDQQAGLLWIINIAYRADGVNLRFPIEATNGEQCVLVLKKDQEHSRWCQTNVFAIIKGFEVR